jgi:hypothetical protein
MPTQLTADDARQSLSGHLAARAAEVRAKYGPNPGWPELLRMLQDRACVRYPCDIVFDAAPLLPGELAHPIPKGERPEDGYLMHVQPCFQTRLDDALHLVLYQLVLVNYGPFASADDAEAFGAGVLGLSRDDYYQALCRLADGLGPVGGCAGH